MRPLRSVDPSAGLLASTRGSTRACGLIKGRTRPSEDGVKQTSGQRWITAFAIAGVLLLHGAAAQAGSVVVTIVDGRTAVADITLQDPNGPSIYTAEFELEFETENLKNLTVECVGITADVLGPSEIVNIESRLPHPTTQHVDSAFPVRVTVEPPAGCGLQFQNQYDVSLDTPDLVYEPFSKYRLVKAPIGGSFRYVTGSVESGSVRARGRAGGFSEFVLIRDDATPPSYYIDCLNEYDTLEARIENSSISLTARHALETDLAVSRAAYEAGNYADAITLLQNFDAHCVEYGGAALPNIWRSARDLDDIEGDLVGHTGNLRFLMGRLNGTP